MSFSWKEIQELEKTEVRNSIVSPSEIERLLSMAQHIKYENNKNYQNVPKEDVLEHIEEKKKLRSNLCDLILEMSEKIRARRIKAEQELENDN